MAIQKFAAPTGVNGASMQYQRAAVPLEMVCSGVSNIFWPGVPFTSSYSARRKRCEPLTPPLPSRYAQSFEMLPGWVIVKREARFISEERPLDGMVPGLSRPNVHVVCEYAGVRPMSMTRAVPIKSCLNAQARYEHRMDCLPVGSLERPEKEQLAIPWKLDGKGSAQK